MPKIVAGFDVGAPVPVDTRMICKTTTERDAIPEGVRFEGLEVFVEETKIKYRLEDGITNDCWVDVQQELKNKKHIHTNKDELDKIQTGDVENWNNKADKEDVNEAVKPLPIVEKFSEITTSDGMDFIFNGYYDATGKLVTDDTYSYQKYKVTAGKTYRISGHAVDSETPCFVGTDSIGNVTIVQHSDDFLSSITVTLPNDTCYLYVNTIDGATVYKKVKKLEIDENNLESGIVYKINEAHTHENKSELDSITEETVKKANGAEQAEKKNQPGGYPSLDSEGKVPTEQMPVDAVKRSGEFTDNGNILVVSGEGLAKDSGVNIDDVEKTENKDIPGGYVGIGEDGKVSEDVIPENIARAEDIPDVTGKEDSSNKDQPNGYPGLDAFGKIKVGQLPEVSDESEMSAMIPSDLSYEVVKGVKVGYFGSIKDDSECFTVYIKIPNKKFACIYATAKNATDNPNNDGSSYSCSTLVCDENKTKIDKITSSTAGNYTCFNFSNISSVDGACYVALSYVNGTEFEVKLHAIDAVNESYLPISETDLPEDFIINGDNLITGLSNVYYTPISNQNTWKYSANAVTELFEIANGKIYYHNGNYVYILLFDEDYNYLSTVSNFASGSILECDDATKYAYININGANSAVADDFWFSEVDLSSAEYKPYKKVNPKYIRAISGGINVDMDAIEQAIATAQETADNAQADIDALKEAIEGNESEEAVVTKDSHFVASDIEYEIVEGKKVNYYGTQLLDDENCFTVYIKIPNKKFAYIKTTMTNSIHTISEKDYTSSTLLCNSDKSIISKGGHANATIYSVLPYSAILGVEGATYFAISYANGTEFEVKINGVDAVNKSYLPVSETSLPEDLIVKADNLVTEIEDLCWSTGAKRWTYSTTSTRTNFFEVENGDVFYHNGKYIYFGFLDENYTYLGASPVISSGVTAVEMENVKYAYAYSTTAGNISSDLWISRIDLSRKKYKPHNIINPEYIDLYDIDRNQIKNWYSGKRASFLGDSLTQTGSGGLYINYLNEFFGFLSVTNCGKGGTLVSGETISMGDPFWYDSRVNAIDIDSDVIFIAGGTNDANNNIELGSKDISNCDTSTFYGAYHVLLSKLIYKFYKLDAGYYSDIDYSGVTQVEEAKQVQIFLITPPYMMGNETAYNKTPGFAEAVIEIGKLLGIPICDTRANSGVNIFTASYHRTTNDDGSFDYIHLNDEAHKNWAKVIIGKMLEVEPLE